MRIFGFRIFCSCCARRVILAAIYLGLLFCVTETGFGAVTVPSVSAGHGHSLLLTSDGALWGMGDNHMGQLGNGNTFPPSQTTPFHIVSDVTFAAAGDSHSLFVKSDGSLWGMGNNMHGQLGDGTMTSRSSPVQIATNAVSAAAGYGHSLFIKSDGSLWAVGLNMHGQLGNGSSIQRVAPVQVAAAVVAVAAGGNHSLFIKSDLTLWGMGLNNRGQLGDGSTVTRLAPVQIATGVMSVSVGGNHSLFLKSDGTLWAMGNNDYGQLGDGSAEARFTPVQIATGVISIAAGGFHSLFLKSDGTLWGMGINTFGALGGSEAAYFTPIQMETGVVSMATASNHSLYSRTDGTVWALGNNEHGQLGDGTLTKRPAPVQSFPGISPVITQSPVSQTISEEGMQDITLAVAATGPGLSYQWYSGASGDISHEIARATSASLVLQGPSLHPGPQSYWVRVSNGYGHADSGAAVITVRLPQFIHFSRPPEFLFVSDLLPLQANATSNLPVIFTIEGPATLDEIGNHLRFTGPGTVSITSTQPGNDLYSPASAVSYTITVSKLSQFIHFSPPPEQLFVSELLFLNADSTSLLPVTFTIEGPATLDETGHHLTFTGPGIVSITATQPGNDLYAAASSATYTITVSKVPQSLTFPPISSQVFGSAPLVLNASSTSLLPVTYSVVSGPATVSGNILTLTGGGTVTLRASQSGNATYIAAASVDRTFTVHAKPAIVTQPVSTTVLLGKPATFKVSATGTPAPSYQWRFNGKNIPGATTSSYTLSKTVAANVGDYSVVIKNSAGAVISADARLSFGSIPRITAQPSAAIRIAGQSVTLKVSAAGTAPFTYQWRLDGKSIPGATQSSYSRSKVTDDDAGIYSVVVRNALGSVTSANARLIVNQPPVITGQPAPTIVALGKTATFKITATGTPGLTYQWRLDGKNIAGATKSSYSLSSVSAKQAGDYTVVVKNPYGSATSTKAALVVVTSPVITRQPSKLTVSSGTVATFRVTATGGSLSYQWHFKDAPLPGATKSALTINNVSSSQAGDYSVVIRNVAGSVTSAKARLTVTPAIPLAPASLSQDAVIHLTGMIIDAINGDDTEDVTLVGGDITDYTRTGPDSATLSYEVTIVGSDFSETETGSLSLAFASPGAGTYSGSGSYEGTHDVDGVYEGIFTSTGTFATETSP